MHTPTEHHLGTDWSSDWKTRRESRREEATGQNTYNGVVQRKRIWRTKMRRNHQRDRKTKKVLCHGRLGTRKLQMGRNAVWTTKVMSYPSFP